MSNQLNGLNLEEIQRLAQQIQEDPSMAQPLNEWSARFRWQEGFRGQALVRQHTFVVDEPATLGGQDDAPNAVEYVLGALGGCLCVGFILNATMRGIQVRNLEFALDGCIDNILTFFGFSKEGHPGYREVAVRAYVDAEADDATLEQIWADTVATSPVGNSLARSVALRPQLARIEA